MLSVCYNVLQGMLTLSRPFFYFYTHEATPRVRSLSSYSEISSIIGDYSTRAEACHCASFGCGFSSRHMLSFSVILAAQ